MFSTAESWRLIAYCGGWAIYMETYALAFAFFFPEEVGFTIDLSALAFVVPFTIVLDVLLIAGMVKLLSPRFINWYLERSSQTVD